MSFCMQSSALLTILADRVSQARRNGAKYLSASSSSCFLRFGSLCRAVMACSTLSHAARRSFWRREDMRRMAWTVLSTKNSMVDLDCRQSQRKGESTPPFVAALRSRAGPARAGGGGWGAHVRLRSSTLANARCGGGGRRRREGGELLGGESSVDTDTEYESPALN